MPNALKEYEEILRYKSVSFAEWKDMIGSGKILSVDQNFLLNLGNTTANTKIEAIEAMSDLETDKIRRVEHLFKTGSDIEYPIVTMLENGHYDLVSGNTRLTYMVANNIKPIKVLFVELEHGR